MQGCESEQFLSLFPKITVCLGGVKAGWKHVTQAEHVSQLFQVRTLETMDKMCVTVREVPIGSGSLNSGDVFLLNGRQSIYQWQGKNSSPRERAKAAEVGRWLADEQRQGKVKLVVFGNLNC